MEFSLTQGDTEPSLRAILKDGANTVARLFPGDVVKFRMTPESKGLRGDIDADAVINSPDAGDVEYDWADGDTDVPGVYSGEFYVVKATGKKKTFPNKETIQIVIKKKASAA